MAKTTWARLSVIVVALTLVVAACGGDAGPAEGFDVTGQWSEDGGSSITFTPSGGYDIVFSPGLSDGTTRFSGENFERVDNAHLTFTVLLGFDIVEVEASITSDEVLKFSLDGRDFRFTRSGS